jgi:growth factor-regulated tyrosine kinase substrate
MIDTADIDPELARYLNRNYWQQKSETIKTTTTTSTTQPSAPVAQQVEPKNTQGGGKVQEVNVKKKIKVSQDIFSQH